MVQSRGKDWTWATLRTIEDFSGLPYHVGEGIAFTKLGLDADWKMEFSNSTDEEKDNFSNSSFVQVANGQ